MLLYQPVEYYWKLYKIIAKCWI